MPVFTFDIIRKHSFIPLLSYVILTVVGLLLGACVPWVIVGDSFDFVQALPTCAVHSSALFITVFLPLAFTYFAVRWNKCSFLWLILFLKTVLFSFSASTVFFAFPNSGWFIHLLVLFSDYFSITVYHWIWLRALVFRSLSVPRDFYSSAGFLVLTFLSDILFVSPFTNTLFI